MLEVYLIIFVLLSIVVAFLIYASANIRSGVYIKTLNSNKAKEKSIALTFDDGPDSIQTEKVLDILKEYNVSACFFCIGNKIDGNENILKRIVDEGHLIGNHTFSHSPTFTMQPFTKVSNELLVCEKEIERVIIDKVQLFRPPFGVTNPVIAKAVRKLNYTTIGWNVRSLDTCKSIDKSLKHIRQKLKGGSIVLLHDPLPQSEVLLRNLLDYSIEQGYKIERVDKLLDLNIN